MMQNRIEKGMLTTDIGKKKPVYIKTWRPRLPDIQSSLLKVLPCKGDEENIQNCSTESANSTFNCKSWK